MLRLAGNSTITQVRNSGKFVQLKSLYVVSQLLLTPRHSSRSVFITAPQGFMQQMMNPSAVNSYLKLKAYSLSSSWSALHLNDCVSQQVTGNIAKRVLLTCVIFFFQGCYPTQLLAQNWVDHRYTVHMSSSTGVLCVPLTQITTRKIVICTCSVLRDIARKKAKVIFHYCDNKLFLTIRFKPKHALSCNSLVLLILVGMLTKMV